MRKIVWTYWENRQGSKEPNHIILSRLSMLINLANCAVIFVTPENVEKYLPGINTLIKGIEVDVKGRFDLLSRKFTATTRKNIAVKCDVIRAFLLYHYGGIYIDADAIVLNDFETYFSMLQKKEFIISQRQSHGKDHMSVGFYGSIAKGKIMTDYVSCIKARLKKNKRLSYNELGAGMITPIIHRHLDTAHIYPEKETQPITFEDSVKKFSSNSLSIESVFTENQNIFMLFNDPFHGKISNMSIDEFYYSDMLISKVFRKAINPKALTLLQSA